MHVAVTDVSIADTSHDIGTKLFSHYKNTLIKLKKVELFYNQALASCREGTGSMGVFDNYLWGSILFNFQCKKAIFHPEGR